ncbi:MAG TPA: cupin domain-containing protein [Xanthobacteraceae bacterium]|nr:cupin domain-containing protein [Xanthobacteraceae bacterium]
MTELKAPRTTVVRKTDTTVFSRGNGVETTLLIGNQVAGSNFTSGLTRFPPGMGAPLHYHNCDEQVTILEGQAEFQVEDRIETLGVYDSTFIPAGKPHRFTNIGTSPLVIMWIYDAPVVTRTFAATGQTVEHLSGGDLVK